MRSVNLYMLTRNLGENFTKQEKALSQRNEELKRKDKEIGSLRRLVDKLQISGLKIEEFDNFYFSFSIPQIGKEFDLLKIGDKKIVNIELKSDDVDQEKIKEQLKTNRYYLSYLQENIVFYTYVSETDVLYQLKDDNLIIGNYQDLINSIVECSNCYSENIESLFKVSAYLVSPLNTPQKFLEGKYFLTQQQKQIKKEIEKHICERQEKYCFIGVTGAPGTGKTLLLYDLAVEYSNFGKVCFIHCGILCEGHNYLNDKLENVDIIAAKQLKDDFNFANYQYIFVDETQRIYKKQFELIVSSTKKNNLKTFFGFDAQQILSKDEFKRNIPENIKALDNYYESKLSNKVRTNKEIASFITKLFKTDHHDNIHSYTSVYVVYANTESECKNMINYFSAKNYYFINYTESTYYGGSFDIYSKLRDKNTHEVIGQEFDNVLMLINEEFGYEDNKLSSREHPNPNYLYIQLLFQGLTRVREKLAIIVLNNEEVYTRIIKILNNEI